jgi:hypothetical protein
MHRLRTRQDGNTLIETSLILTVALVTFIGLIDLGSVLFRLQGLAERARAGARWGVVNTYNATGIRNVVIYGNSAGSGTPLLMLSPSLVSVSVVDLGDGILKIRVVISNYPFRFFTPFLAGDRTLPAVEVALTAESLGATS